MAYDHKYTVHDESCDKDYCFVCDGGLLFCTVCFGAEASLPTECPERPLTDIEQQQIQNGQLDYVLGAWVRKRGAR